MIAQPLDDLRVLDLGQVYNGPYCSLLLAAQGAEVIKVEPPGGEIVRRHETSPGGASYSFLMLNAGKKGVTLNLKEPRGRDLFLALVEKSDVVLENFREGVLADLGLGWDVLAARNPRIILASGRGYRPGSPYARFGAMDCTVQAISGHLFGAILLALRDRERTGRGRPVEVAMLDATFPALMGYSSPYLERGFDAGRTANRHSVPGSSPYGIYPTADGWVAIMCVTDAHWLDFVTLVGDADLATDETLRRGPARAAQRDRVDAHVSAWTRDQSREGVIDLLSSKGIPCAPVRELGEAVDDPYNVDQGLLRWTTYEGRGDVRVLGSPIQLRDPGESTASGPAPSSPPRLGEHNREIFGGLLGLDDEKLAELRAAGVL
jgi:crotonobetainyl-CoA:carnitine CoA-transferase CaiB-like acyl-CoA transferase